MTINCRDRNQNWKNEMGGSSRFDCHKKGEINKIPHLFFLSGSVWCNLYSCIALPITKTPPMGWVGPIPSKRARGLSRAKGRPVLAILQFPAPIPSLALARGQLGCSQLSSAQALHPQRAQATSVLHFIPPIPFAVVSFFLVDCACVCLSVFFP